MWELANEVYETMIRNVLIVYSISMVYIGEAYIQNTPHPISPLQQAGLTVSQKGDTWRGQTRWGGTGQSIHTWSEAVR